MLGPIFYSYLFIVNCVAFFMYADDKRRACLEQWRTPNALLLSLAVIGGAYGAAMGMLLFRHKTQSKPYTSLVPISLALWLALLVILCIFA